MKCVQTMSGVFAIVGAGYLMGTGQSFFRDKPVILGAVRTTQTLPQDTPSENNDLNAIPVVEVVQSEQTVGNDPSTESSNELTEDAEYNARLDAPVPEGMLTLREAHQLWLDGAYFVDSRLPHEYEAGHVSLAAYLTAANFFSDEGQDALNSIPPDAPVVIYCVGGEECDASHNTLALMQQYGYTDLAIMGVGYDEWAAAGLPTSKNDGSSDEGGAP